MNEKILYNKIRATEVEIRSILSKVDLDAKSIEALELREKSYWFFWSESNFKRALKEAIGIKQFLISKR